MNPDAFKMRKFIQVEAKKILQIDLEDSLIQVSALTNLSLFDVDRVGSFFAFFNFEGNLVVLSNFVH